MDAPVEVPIGEDWGLQQALTGRWAQELVYLWLRSVLQAWEERAPLINHINKAGKCCWNSQTGWEVEWVNAAVDACLDFDLVLRYA